jgi:hypothetical protein
MQDVRVPSQGAVIVGWQPQQPFPASRGETMRKVNTLLLMCLAAVFASSVRAQSTGVNNAELNGNYAFNFNGFSTGIVGIASGKSVVYSAVGRFTADGAGNILTGKLDTNGPGAGAVLTQQSFTGTYTIGADSRGMMTWNIGGNTTQLAFAMTTDGNAQFVEFDPPGASVGSGSMEKSDTTAFSTAKITGDYAFGLAGFDASNNRTSFAGRFTADGAGNLSSAAGDINLHGTVGSAIFTSSTYTVSDIICGRGTMNLGISFGGTAYTPNFVFYIVNSGKLFAMQTNTLVGSTPILSGVVFQQQTPSAGFSNASLQGNMVIYLTGQSYCSNGFNLSADVIAGLLAADSNGALTLTLDENCGGIASSEIGLAGTYSVATNGRTSMAVGNGAVAYLFNQNQAFVLGNDASVLFGFGEPQAAGPLANTSVSGSYTGLATNPATSAATIFSGEFTADGASPTGKLTGTEDIGDATAPISSVPFSATYSLTSSPTNGRGAVTMISPSGATGVAYVISPAKFVIVPLNDPNPSVWLFEH